MYKLGQKLYELRSVRNRASQNKIKMTDGEGIEWFRYEAEPYDIRMFTWTVQGITTTTLEGTPTPDCEPHLLGETVYHLVCPNLEPDCYTSAELKQYMQQGVYWFDNEQAALAANTKE
jgi:hypothetical protein